VKRQTANGKREASTNLGWTGKAFCRFLILHF